MDTRAALLLTIISIFGAHALAYFLVGVLPDAAATSLGLESAREGVVAAFRAAHAVRPYPQTLADLLRLDLGLTLDGLPVSSELLQALQGSLPRVGAAAGLVTVLCIVTALVVQVRGPGPGERLAAFVAFLPPYILPFLSLLGLLTVQGAFGASTADAISPAAAVLAIAVAPAAVLATQSATIMRRNLASDFARTLVASGATISYQRRRLLPNLAAEIAPSFEKMLVAMIAALLFAEPVLGLNGFGTLTVRAIRRSDMNLILGVTVLLSVAVGFARLAASLVRRHYGLRL